MSSTSLTAAELTAALKQRATELGFDLCGVAEAARPEGFDWLRRWLDRGFAGEMSYIPRRESAYEHPRDVLASVRSVVMLAMNYRTEESGASLGNGDAQSESPATQAGRVSRYAWGKRDYHDVLRERLKQLADFLHEQHPGCRTRGVVDTAPLLERDFARQAGLGWFGKNTMLINKRIGSWFFLAGLLTDVELVADAPHNTSHCGTCTRCLEACPTDAFVEPCVLDARKCISYLTIELRDQPIPTELRPLMGDWIFGCDVCQDVCPWNRKAPISDEPAFEPRERLNPAKVDWLLQLDDAAFDAEFLGTPMQRTGRAALLRNAVIAIGNCGDQASLPALSQALNDVEPLVRGAAAWALNRLGGSAAIVLLQERQAIETNAGVHEEITAEWS
ncbi:MAG: tRNA epoxyqueuosine(34) reductase QueG [Planctomycetia bacterium]|nr:tRNA epoxyqueuosine(34) reductase QueG [Planctomycetia bacterium]